MAHTLSALADLNKSRLLRLCDSMRENGLDEYLNVARQVLTTSRMGIGQRMDGRSWRVLDDGTLQEEV